MIQSGRSLACLSAGLGVLKTTATRYKKQSHPPRPTILEQAVAAIFAVGVLALAMVPLLRIPHITQQDASANSTVLTLLARVIQQPSVSPTPPVRRRGAQANSIRPSTARQQTTPQGQTSLPPSAARTPLDLSLREVAPATSGLAPYVPDIMRTTPNSDFAPQPKPLNTVRLRDSSLMGKMSRMSRAYDCGELRAAMSRMPESTETILATMKRRGCDQL